MVQHLKDSAQRVQDKLSELGYLNKVVELPESTRTAQEAAEAIGCDVAQIAKSIIFRLKATNRPLLVVASGVNRVSEMQVSNQIGEILAKANAEFVRDRTGFVIGGVPPLGHVESVTTIVDEDLFKFQTVWAAAGHPRAVFALTPGELVEMTKARVMAIK